MPKITSTVEDEIWTLTPVEYREPPGEFEMFSSEIDIQETQGDLHGSAIVVYGETQELADERAKVIVTAFRRWKKG